MSEMFPHADSVELWHALVSLISLTAAIIVFLIALDDKLRSSKEEEFSISANASLERTIEMLIMQALLSCAAVISVKLPPPNPGDFSDQAAYFRYFVIAAQMVGTVKSVREYMNRVKLWHVIKVHNRRKTDVK